MLECSTENDLVAGVRSGLDYTGSISQLVTSPILPQQPYSHTDGTIYNKIESKLYKLLVKIICMKVSVSMLKYVFKSK